MRRIVLPLAISLLASYGYGCAASEDSVPAGGGGTTSHGGTPAIGGSLSPGVSGSGVTSAGTSPGTGGVSSTAGSTGTAGSTVTTGTAGTTATGTAGAGTGGAPPASATCAMSAVGSGMPTLVIDDFEDGNSDVGVADGRVGGWFLATDGTGSTTPMAPIAPKPADGGMPGKALHVTGTGLTSWGASLSASITPAMGCYDASKFTGVTVMLKGTGSIWVSVLTAAVRGAPVGQQNQYKKMVALTADWTPVTINFTELTQPGGWGVIVPFDATKVYGIDFGPATAPPTPTAFDFWVDNLSFKM